MILPLINGGILPVPRMSRISIFQFWMIVFFGVWFKSIQINNGFMVKNTNCRKTFIVFLLILQQTCISRDLKFLIAWYRVEQIQCESFIMESQMTRFVLFQFCLSMRTVLIHRNGLWVASNKFVIGQSETKTYFKKRKDQSRIHFGKSTLSSSINKIGRGQIESFGFLW